MPFATLELLPSPLSFAAGAAEDALLSSVADEADCRVSRRELPLNSYDDPPQLGMTGVGAAIAVEPGVGPREEDGIVESSVKMLDAEVVDGVSQDAPPSVTPRSFAFVVDWDAGVALGVCC